MLNNAQILTLTFQIDIIVTYNWHFMAARCQKNQVSSCQRLGSARAVNNGKDYDDESHLLSAASHLFFIMRSSRAK